MKITTNHKSRDLLSYWDLTPKELKEFDYIENMEEEGIARFFRYRGSVYDTNEFMRIPDSLHWQSEEIIKWHGYQSDSYFSGVLIRYSEDYEAVKVGFYFS